MVTAAQVVGLFVWSELLKQQIFKRENLREFISDSCCIEHASTISGRNCKDLRSAKTSVTKDSIGCLSFMPMAVALHTASVAPSPLQGRSLRGRRCSLHLGSPRCEAKVSFSAAIVADAGGLSPPLLLLASLLVVYWLHWG